MRIFKLKYIPILETNTTTSTDTRSTQRYYRQMTSLLKLLFHTTNIFTAYTSECVRAWRTMETSAELEGRSQSAQSQHFSRVEIHRSAPKAEPFFVSRTWIYREAEKIASAPDLMSTKCWRAAICSLQQETTERVATRRWSQQSAHRERLCGKAPLGGDLKCGHIIHGRTRVYLGAGKTKLAAERSNDNVTTVGKLDSTHARAY